jgi:hypothetical protein
MLAARFSDLVFGCQQNVPNHSDNEIRLVSDAVARILGDDLTRPSGQRSQISLQILVDLGSNSRSLAR